MTQAGELVGAAGVPVTKTKYRIGDRVDFKSATVGSPGTRQGYTVMKILPVEQGEQQYRIKSSGEQHERVATESQLDPRG